MTHPGPVEDYVDDKVLATGAGAGLLRVERSPVPPRWSSRPHLISHDAPVTRYGAQYGPDITFLGIARCDLEEEGTYADADVVILGAPFDGGTSHRPGTRFGPQAIRMTDYLAHDGSRPSLALRTDGLQDLGSSTQATSRCLRATSRRLSGSSRPRSRR